MTVLREKQFNIVPRSSLWLRQIWFFLRFVVWFFFFVVFVVFVFFLARGFLGDAAGFFVLCPSAAGGSALSVGAGGV